MKKMCIRDSIYNRAKKLHIDADVRRVVMIMELQQEKDHNAMEAVKSFFGGKTKDFITAVDERSIIIVKQLEDGEDYSDMDKLAHAILDTLGFGLENDTHIAVSYTHLDVYKRQEQRQTWLNVKL